MKATFIYATNSSQIIYKFRIIDETETEYVVLDAETTSYEMSQVKFFINKEDLCKARCEEKHWEFVVTREFFASFELNEVKKEYYRRQIIIIKHQIFCKETELSTLEDIHNQKTKKEYNKFFSFNDFKLGDKIYVLYEKKLYETKVVSFVTLDKINFVPNINVYFGDTLEDYVELKQRENGELYLDLIEQYHDDIKHIRCKVFLSREDYDVYLEMVEYENEIIKINNLKNSIEYYKRELEKWTKLNNEL